MRREIIAIALMDETVLTRSPTGHRRMVFRRNKTLEDSLEMYENEMRREMIGNIEIAIASAERVGKHKGRTWILKVTTNLRTYTAKHHNLRRASKEPIDKTVCPFVQ